MDTKSVGHSQDIRKHVDATSTRRAEPAKADESNKNQRSGSKGVDLQLSSEAKELAKARAKALEIARETPDVREEKIAELKARINSGLYKVDPGNVADGILIEAIRDELAKDSTEIV